MHFNGQFTEEDEVHCFLLNSGSLGELTGGDSETGENFTLNSRCSIDFNGEIVEKIGFTGKQWVNTCFYR